MPTSQRATLAVDQEGRILSVNAAATSLLGYRQEELIGESVERLVPERHRQKHARLRAGFFEFPAQRLMGAGLDVFVRRKDGEEIRVEISLEPLEGATARRVLVSLVEARGRERSQERFRQAVEASPSAMLMVGGDGAITMVNRQAEELFGYDRMELLGRPVELLMPERLADGHTRLRDAFFANPVARPIGTGRDLVAQRADGRVFPVEIGLEPIDLGVETQVLVSVVEITERKRSEDLFRLAVDASPSAMLLVDESGAMTMVNRRAELLFGYQRSELLTRPVEMLVPERFRAAHPELRQGFLDQPSSRPMGVGRNLFGLRSDGTEVPVEIGLNPITTSDSQLTLVSIIDITERKRSEERFELAVEASPSAMLLVDESGAINLVNRQAEELFGYDRGELLGEPVEMLVPERFRHSHPGLREGFHRSPSSRPMGAGRDLYGLRRDGREVPVEIGLTPIATAAGPLVLASIIDITERREAEARLKRSLEEKEVLLQEVHHRVKNNLAAIGSIFYLQSTVTRDDETLRILQDCRDRVRSMALVHERLYRSEDLARVDFADYTRELVRELVSSHRPVSERVALRLDLDEVVLEIDRAIPAGLVLTELVSNAFRHAFPNDRSGSLQVALRRVGEHGFTLEVADDGVGLSEDSGDSRGSLGLRLAHSLATQLEGRFELRRGASGVEASLIVEEPE